MKAFWNGFEKRAVESDEPSWWQKQKGATRALRQSDKGIGKLLVNNDLFKSRLKRSLSGQITGGAAGVLGGGGLGALVGAAHSGRQGALHGTGMGAVLGGLVASSIGGAHGQWKADKEYLKGKGIDANWFGRHKFSPEARAKYIDAYESKQ